jgi:predicted RNA-binding protein with RPS1 domain
MGKERKRKIIDLNENTFKILSIKAAEEGTNLKALIEKSLDKLAEDLQDSQLYSYLLKNYPEGKDIVGKQEKDEFESWLGL